MNVRFKKTFDFSAGVIYDNKFSVNFYTVVVHMTTVNMDGDYHNIAYERMRYWVDEVLSDSILIYQKDPMLDQWLSTEQRIILFPEQPVDQVVGILLYSKFNAITEKQFIINEVEASSAIGDDIVFMHSENEITDVLAQTGWWNDSKPTWISSGKKRVRQNKIIKLDRMPDWKDLDLEFEQSDTNDDNSVVFVEFGKDDKK